MVVLARSRAMLRPQLGRVEKQQSGWLCAIPGNSLETNRIKAMNVLDVSNGSCIEEQAGAEMRKLP